METAAAKSAAANAEAAATADLVKKELMKATYYFEYKEPSTSDEFVALEMGKLKSYMENTEFQTRQSADYVMGPLAKTVWKARQTRHFQPSSEHHNCKHGHGWLYVGKDGKCMACASLLAFMNAPRGPELDAQQCAAFFPENAVAAEYTPKTQGELMLYERGRVLGLCEIAILTKDYNVFKQSAQFAAVIAVNLCKNAQFHLTNELPFKGNGTTCDRCHHSSSKRMKAVVRPGIVFCTVCVTLYVLSRLSLK